MVKNYAKNKKINEIVINYGKCTFVSEFLLNTTVRRFLKFSAAQIKNYPKAGSKINQDDEKSKEIKTQHGKYSFISIYTKDKI